MNRTHHDAVLGTAQWSILVPAVDALMVGTGNSSPPSVILNFMYGVAANRRWHSAAIDQVMKKRHEDK